MKEPTQEELKESIKELANYQYRLEEQMINVSKKLRMPSDKIDSTIEENVEIKQIKNIISKLTNQLSLENTQSEE